MGHISVIGSCNMDITVEAGRRPQAGETVMGSRLIVSPGGKGANQAVAAARLGATVYMIGCVGDDAYGTLMKKALEESGVKTDYVETLSSRQARHTSRLRKGITVSSSSRGRMTRSAVR